MWLFRTTRPSPVPFEKIVRLAADIANATGAYADMPGLTLTFTTGPNSFLWYAFSCSFTDTAAALGAAEFDVQVDGVTIDVRSTNFLALAAAPSLMSFSGVSGVLAAGLHTIKARWNAPATIQCRGATVPATEAASLIAIEVR